MSDMPDFDQMDWEALFDALYPGFFEIPSIQSLPASGSWDEMALDLSAFCGDAPRIETPGGITFGLYAGDPDALRREVARVDATWPEFFGPDERVYCAFDGDNIASFCILERMGEYESLRVGGPGCVGALPEYRRRGIGLKMVQNATAILKAEGYDISFIHYTGVASWYAKLGYQTVLRWDHRGII